MIMIRIHNFTTDCDECGTYFRYCVQEFLSVNESEECQESYCFVNQEPGITLDFSREFLLLQSNPIVFWGQSTEWKVSNNNHKNLKENCIDKFWPLWFS